MLNPYTSNEIGQSGIFLTQLGLGGVLVGMDSHTSESDSVQTVKTALGSGINYIDTSPFYGHGLSEQRLAIALEGIPKSSYVISSKVGRILVPDKNPESTFFDHAPFRPVFDFSYDGVMKSFESSLSRLGISSIDILYIHDIDRSEFSFREAMNGAVVALNELREQKIIGAWGTGLNVNDWTSHFIEYANPDICLLAGRYTLLDQTALLETLPIMKSHGVKMVIGGPFNSGILASNLSEGATFNYEKAAPEMLAKAREIKKLCDEFGVPLKAASLQFPMHHPAVISIIPGARKSQEVLENIELFQIEIPNNFWQALRESSLIDPNSVLPV